MRRLGYVLVISLLQELTIAQAAQTPGHVLQVGVQRKLAANLSACRSSRTDFVPLVVLIGGLAEDTMASVSSPNISRAIENRCGTSDSTHYQSPVWPRGSGFMAGQCIPLCGSTVSVPTIPPFPGLCSLNFLYSYCLFFTSCSYS